MEGIQPTPMPGSEAPSGPRALGPVLVVFLLAVAVLIAFALGFLIALPRAGPPDYHPAVQVTAIPGTVWLRWSGIAMTLVCEYPYNVSARSSAPVLVNVTVVTNRSFLVNGVWTWSHYDTVFYELQPAQTVVYPAMAEQPGESYTVPSQCPAWTLSVAAYYVSA